MYGRLRLPLLLQVRAPNLILFLCIVTLLLQGWSIEAFVGFDGQVQQSKLLTVAIYGNPSHCAVAIYGNPSHCVQALDCVDGTSAWADDSMHAFRSPGACGRCSVVSGKL